MRQDVFCHGSDEGFARHGDRLEGGLEGSAPALPLAGGVGGGGG